MTDTGNNAAINKGMVHTQSGKVQCKRNKKTNADGVPYENRHGLWTALDKAVLGFGILLTDWLIPERCEIELFLLNPPGKRGPKFRYPPSLILYICLLKEDNGRSYRRAVAGVHALLRHMGLEMPNYSTLHKNEGLYFNSGLGHDVMSKASEILASRGIHESLDPCMLVGTGINPEYRAPGLLVDSEAKGILQELMDEEAEKLSRMMEVMTFKNVVDEGREHDCAVDGSGEGVSGPGIYFEHIWKVNNRRFIKQHVALDVRTREVLAFSITMEKPGDAAVFVPLMEGAKAAGLRIGRVYADSAYDTVANWTFSEDSGIEFHPNLKATFGERHDLPRRNEEKRAEDAMGKTAFHRLTGYNIRWLVEVFFSVLKKLYGDRVANRKFDRMVLTMRLRYRLYMIRRGFINRAREGPLTQ